MVIAEEARKGDLDPVAVPNPSADPAVAVPSPGSELKQWRGRDLLPLLGAACLLAVLALWQSRRKSNRLSDQADQLARKQAQMESTQQRLKQEAERLRQEATHDPLTEVLNRRAFTSELKGLLESLGKFRRPMNLIIVDLDHFKAINDRLGHLVGDGALKLVVRVVLKHLTREQKLGRFGGDEFLIACPDRSLDEAEALANEIRRAVLLEAGASTPALYRLSLSMGIAQANPDTGYQADALFQRADLALYAAKEAGRNRVVVADADPMDMSNYLIEVRQLT